MRSLLRAAARLIPPGLPLPILRGPLQGAWWISGAAAGTGGGLSILVNQAEPEQLARAASLVTPESICFDLGANAGLYTLLWAKRAKHVYAFEPSPRCVAALHRTLALNRVKNATILPWAVGDRDLRLAFFSEGENVALGRLDEQGEQPTIVVSVDEFAAAFKVQPDVLKIDVEGAEVDVLIGARVTLDSRPAILLSTHTPALTDACLWRLKKLGYRCEALTPDETEWICT
jgi:FkbM family methyltransferase